jgi:hypothetical protein
MRELVAKDVTSVYEAMMQVAVEGFNEGSEVPPQLIFFKMSDATPGVIDKMSMLEPELLNVLVSSAETRAVMTKLVAATLAGEGPLFQKLNSENGFAPNVVIFLMEA